MSVSNYNPFECTYRIDKLDNVVYLIPEAALRNIKIDNGYAYVENIEYEPIYFNCYNISLEDTDTLDERYEFTHTLKFSVNGYVNHNDFQGCYYVIVKSVDNEYWLVNPLFPCKITYTYTLGYQDNHTDFTLSTVSNHPTLRIHNMNQGRAYPCNGYLLNSFDRLFLNEKMFSSHSGKDVYYTNSGFKEVIYDKKSATFQEQFDGDNVSHSIQFNIKFDDYKSSWHYNLLEFQDNLYAAIITTTKGEYVLCGFSFGLQPSYTVTSDGEMTPDHIEIRLVDMHDNGDLFTLVTGGTISPNNDRVYNYTTKYDAWECVSDGYAKYLLQEEFDVLGNPTGHYKCLEGYEERFAFLGDALIGTFDEVVTFYQPQCKESGCTLSTSLPSTVKMFGEQCIRFSVRADSDWSITNNASYLTFTPTSGEANINYTVILCNTRPQSAETVTTSFIINYCSTAETYTVQVGKGNGCFYGGDEFEIGPEGQYVTIPIDCCVDSVTNSALTNIQIFENYIKVYVPQNNTESARTFTLDVTLCDDTDSEVTITQTNAYTRWVKEGTTCLGKLKCDVERMYSGTTSGDINTWTTVVRTTNCIPSSDCGGSTTRWVETEETVCFEGRKYIVEKEQVKSSTDSDWIDTGNTRRGAETQDSPAECSGSTVYEYQWSATTGYVCSGTNKMTREIYQRRISGSSDPWENVVPTQERAAQPMIESASTDCGYVPPIEPIYKWENMNINTDYICEGTTKYYKQQRYVSYDNGNTWQPLSEYRKGALYQEDSEDCGYSVVYKWENVIGEYTCSGCTKYQKTQKYVSYDGGTTWSAVSPAEYGIGNVIEYGSEDCGCSTQYRWLTLPITEYICIGTTKYYKQKYQVSYDNGVTWEDVVPERTRANGIIEEESVDCGYGQPIYRWVDGTMCDDCVPYKVKSITTLGTNVNVQCNSSSTLSVSDVTNRTSIISSTIGNCINIIGDGAYSGCTSLNSVRIPSTVSSIGNQAFRGCVALLDASIPDSVTSIGDYAFSGCTQLNYVNLPNYLTTLGTYAFRDSLNFSSINIPVTLTYIPEGCFYNCDGLSDIVLPNSIRIIGDEAFRNCDGLYNFTIYALTPPTLGNNVFYNVNLDFKILVPPSAVDTYKQASGWSDYASNIFPITN